MDSQELPFIGMLPEDVIRFVKESYSGHKVGACKLRAVNVSTNGVPARNIRAGVRALASQTLRAVELLRVMRANGDGVICEFVILELDAERGPLRQMASAFPTECRGAERLYTTLNTGCLTERSLDELHHQLGIPRREGD